MENPWVNCLGQWSQPKYWKNEENIILFERSVVKKKWSDQQDDNRLSTTVQ